MSVCLFSLLWHSDDPRDVIQEDACSLIAGTQSNWAQSCESVYAELQLYLSLSSPSQTHCGAEFIQP